MTEPAHWTVLCGGYVGDRVASTVTYVRDGDIHIVIDPGMVASRDLILAPLARLSVAPDEVLAVAQVVVPGHGAPFTPDAGTPR